MKNRLVFLILAFSVAPLLVIVLYILVVSDRSEEREAEIEIRKEIDLSGIALSEFVQQQASIIRMLSQMSIPRVALDFERPEPLQRQLNSVVSEYSAFDLIFTFDKNHSFFSANSADINVRYLNPDLIQDAKETFTNIALSIHQDAVVQASSSCDGESNYEPFCVYIGTKIVEPQGGVLGYIVARISSYSLHEATARISSRLSRFKNIEVNFLLDSRDVEKRSFQHCAQIPSLGDKAILCAIVPNNSLHGSKLSLLLWAFGLVPVLGVLSYFAIGRVIGSILKPFDIILYALNSVADGNLISVRVNSQFPEFRSVGDHLNAIIDRLRTFSKRIQETSRSEALAKMVQMLAHDVRKPFSSLEMGLNLVKQAKSNQEMREMADRTINTVQKALVTVNGLIDDVMEIGRTNAPKTKPVAAETLIEKTLLELFQVQEKAKIHVDIRLQHPENLALDIEDLKVLRVFSNILGNAVQAVKREGTLLISTCEASIEGQTFIEIILGNSGPAIPPEALPQLFEAFYTSGKEGGTGLGLAIAKKVVTAHGGKIWCESPGKRMPVEFHFTLPATTEAPTQPLPTLPLPRTSDEVYERLKPKSDPLANPAEVTLIADPREAKFEREILTAVALSKQSLRIVVIDDELIYRNAVTQLLGDNPALERSLVFTTISSGTEALADQAIHIADAVICDIDLGPESCNGYEVIRTLRCRAFHGTLCVHSNRSLPEDFKQAMEAGADTVFPKPMSRAHFLQILASAASKKCAPPRSEPWVSSTALAPSTTPKTQAQKTQAQKPPFPYRFAVIDDDGIVRSAWQAAFGDSVQTFVRAEDLLGDGTVLEEIRDALSQFDFVVTDFYLDDNGAIPTGSLVATIVQRFHPIPVFLCSSVDWDEMVFSKLFAGRLTKFDDLGKKLNELITQAGISPRQATGLDIDALYRLRHDIRNYLANLQIIARRLPENNLAQISEDASSANKALSALEPHCDLALIAQMKSTLSQLVLMPEDDSARPQALRQIHKLAQDLTLAHHMDSRWINPETHPLHKLKPKPE